MTHPESVKIPGVGTRDHADAAELRIAGTGADPAQQAVLRDKRATAALLADLKNFGIDCDPDPARWMSLYPLSIWIEGDTKPAPEGDFNLQLLSW